MSGYNISQDIRFQLRDQAQGLTNPVSTVTYLFEDDPAPLGSDDGALTVVVDFSKDGSCPVNVHSLSSSFMVSGFKWKMGHKKERGEEEQSEKEEKDSDADGESVPYNKLLVEGISLERERAIGSVKDAETSALGHRQQFSVIQRDAHALSTRAI
ncbi:hypothetical protein GGF39_001195 [Coemansia sp. RSA 1721]|nr:hypothetical protein GGF39_001195 [Coemansia sp. RSA 1721]